MTGAVIKQTRAVAAGEYFATVAAVALDSGQYGQQLKLSFEIEAGEFAGEELAAWASAKFSSGSKLYRWARALFGAPIPPDYDLNVTHLLGRRCRVIVEERAREDGSRYARVSGVAPLPGIIPPEAPAPAAAPFPAASPPFAAAAAPFPAPAAPGPAWDGGDA